MLAVEWTMKGSEYFATIHGIPVRIHLGPPGTRGWFLQIGGRVALRGSLSFLQVVAQHNVEKMIEAGYDAANPK